MFVRPRALIDQTARLAALRRYGILDTPAEAEFDEITSLIADICETPIAVISFIDEGRQWFKSVIGLGLRETPLDVSICAHAILQRDLFVVHDTLEDERFSCNPLVAGDPRLRFYAGAVLETADRQALGTLCVLDYSPRILTPLQRAALQTLARQVMTQLELRRMNTALEERVVEATSERRKAEEALHQAHKMEAVGQLTGGIAHDFNNLLTIVIGSLEMVERRLGTPDPNLLKPLATALRGAERAATLTQRLLAFSRHQETQPVALDLSNVVTGMVDLLRRTLGEQVAIATELSDALWPVCVDANQLENVLLNLAINARDAMAEAGVLTIRTGNMMLTPADAEPDMELKPGEYVTLCVADTGISAEVVARVFEPFFTTKGVEGTGLGLSMVYGFAKHAQGHVRIESAPGEGAAITLYLPRLVVDASVVDRRECADEPA